MKKPEVTVVGSFAVGLTMRAPKLPIFGETMLGTDFDLGPGGKGSNQAVAAAKAGAPTVLIGRLGEDAFAQELKAFLAGQRVDLQQVVITAGTSTGVALITVHDADNTIVVIPGANGLVTPADVGIPAIRGGDVLVSQFEIPIGAIEAFFSRGRAAGARTILNPAPAIKFGKELLDLVDVLVLNETELGLLAKVDLHEADEPARFADAAKSVLTRPDQIVCVTLGKRGALALINGAPVLVPGRVVKAVDTTGAGDCFVGALAAQLAQGTPLREALGLANIAASICVQRMGASPSMPTRAEVAAAM